MKFNVVQKAALVFLAVGEEEAMRPFVLETCLFWLFRSSASWRKSSRVRKFMKEYELKLRK